MKSPIDKEMARRTRRAFLTGLSCALLVCLVFVWIFNQSNSGNLPWLLRKGHEFNARIWGAIYSNTRLSRARTPARGKEPRINGALGLGDDFDLDSWKMQIFVEDKPVATVTMRDLELLPHTASTTEFKCIEGWSDVMSYAGVRFSDFMKAYKLKDTYRYVGLETPDKSYYVSIDLDSMVHPQTLLAWEMNGQPLSYENGAPLRLIIPVKYGIKSLKRIGKIMFSNTRPRDYWAERGYDWYSGL